MTQVMPLFEIYAIVPFYIPAGQVGIFFNHLNRTESQNFSGV